jgi:hypothetical protein
MNGHQILVERRPDKTVSKGFQGYTGRGQSTHRKPELERFRSGAYTPPGNCRAIHSPPAFGTCVSIGGEDQTLEIR